MGLTTFLSSLRRRKTAAPTPPAAEPAVGYFRIATTDGGVLVAPPGSDLFERCVSVSRGGAVPQAIVAIVPDARRQICLLVAPDGRAIRFAGDVMRGVAASARIVQTDTRGIVRLRQPLGVARFLAATPAGLRFDDVGADMSAAFAMVRLPPADAPARVKAFAAGFGRLTDAGFTAEGLVAGVRDGWLDGGLVEGLLRILPEDEFGYLAERLLTQATDLDVLRRTMPEDRWLREILPALASWYGAREGLRGQVTASATSDERDLLPVIEQTTPPVGLVLTALARRAVRPRLGACILATVRDEGAYLLEWISYHQSIGFEHFFLYTNDNQDGSGELLELLTQHGVITLIQNPLGEASGVQQKAYAHALLMLPQILDYRWTAVLDLDEFLAFDARMFDGIDDFLGFQESQRVDAIALSWVVHGCEAGQAWSDAFTPARFPRRECDINLHVKSLFRTNLFWYAQAHYPFATLDAPFVYRREGGDLHHHPGVTHRLPAFADHPAANVAWVNHYIFRTAAEALHKWDRGRPTWHAEHRRTNRAWFKEFIATSFLNIMRPGRLVEDVRIMACAGGQAAALRSLLVLPGVSECDARLKAAFARRLQVLTEAFLGETMGEGAPESVRRLQSAMREG